MTPVTNATSTAQSVLKPQTLGTTDFLRLMTEQVKQQDPFAPQDNSQMIAQMAQMSASSAAAETSATLRTISTQLTVQTTLLEQLVAANRQGA